jgi:hypothetical protein
MDRPNHRMTRDTRETTERDTFPVCSRCHYIDSTYSGLCTECDSTELERLTLLEVALRFRAMSRKPTPLTLSCR